MIRAKKIGVILPSGISGRDRNLRTSPPIGSLTWNSLFLSFSLSLFISLCGDWLWLINISEFALLASQIMRAISTTFIRHYQSLSGMDFCSIFPESAISVAIFCIWLLVVTTRYTTNNRVTLLFVEIGNPDWKQFCWGSLFKSHSVTQTIQFQLGREKKTFDLITLAERKSELMCSKLVFPLWKM